MAARGHDSECHVGNSAGLRHAAKERSTISPLRALVAPRGFRACLQTRTPPFFRVHDRFLLATRGDGWNTASSPFDYLSGQVRATGSARRIHRGSRTGRRRPAQPHEAPPARSGSHDASARRCFGGRCHQSEEVVARHRLRRSKERGKPGVCSNRAEAVANSVTEARSIDEQNRRKREARSPIALEQFRQNRHAATAADLQAGDFAHSAPSLPLCADLLRICYGGRGALRRSARRMDGLRPHPPLSSLRRFRLRPGGKASDRFWQTVIQRWNVRAPSGAAFISPGRKSRVRRGE
jgi:hypothetical protein